jgi:hypothetical protein
VADRDAANADEFEAIHEAPRRPFAVADILVGAVDARLRPSVRPPISPTTRILGGASKNEPETKTC